VTEQPRAAAGDRVLRWVRFAALVLIIFGVLFRFTGLGAKLFWWDETHTGRAIAGSFWPEILEDIYNGRVLTRDEILVHQFPREGRTTVTTMRMLAWEEPRQTPLYFVLARFWVKAVGSSTTVLRAFSVILSILSLPLTFLLARELFGRTLEAWIAVGLIAVSPLHLVYAQEARQYMLWVDLLLATSWFLLRALSLSHERGRPAWLWFLLYAGALGLTLITHLLTVAVMAAHALFVLASERFRLASSVRLTATAQLVVLLLFIPWSASILEEAQHRSWIPWAATDVGFASWLKMVAGSYARPFFDIDVGIEGLKIIDRAPVIFVLMAVVVGALLLVRCAPRPARLFLLPLGLTCSMPWIAVDLFSGGWRTVLIRYQFPVVIAMHLCVAFAIAYLLTRVEWRWRLVGVGTATLLVACGVFSCVHYGRSEVWWNKGPAGALLAAVSYIEQSPAPLVVSSASDGHSMGTAMSLAHASSERTHFLLVEEPDMPVIPEEFEDVFVWSVTEDMLGRFAGEEWLVLDVGIPDLHRLSRPQADRTEEFPPPS
jgi:uncharacterized membrane protein